MTTIEVSPWITFMGLLVFFGSVAVMLWVQDWSASRKSDTGENHDK